MCFGAFVVVGSSQTYLLFINANYKLILKSNG